MAVRDDDRVTSPRRTTQRRTTRRTLLTGGLAGLAVMSAACGNGAAPSPPAGVDGLEIPTPSPEPGDFAEVVDNPWFPLLVGAEWTYRATAGPGRGEIRVQALRGPVRDGITTTALQRTGPVLGDGAGTSVVDHFAQDVDGNVWWFGRDEEWFAAPGLAMPATPRRGDGFVMADSAALAVQAEVVGLEEAINVPAGSYSEALLLEVVRTTGTTTGTVAQHYVRGIGLVVSGSELLVAHQPPPS